MSATCELIWFAIINPKPHRRDVYFMHPTKELEEKAVNTIRFLAADAVQAANSGHPGMPMGAAAMAYTLWTRHLRYNPKNPDWTNRDRFVLSGGHGSMLLYALLHLTGYDLPMEEIKNFRQWHSHTPGHPEYRCTPGVEVTTGPLGQGLANSVGMAIAEKHLAGIYNKPDCAVINHYTYAIVTDGDLMEGIASEAASLAGHLQLGKLILLYDDNRISIDGSTDLTFTEDVAAKYQAMDWHTIFLEDGNDIEAVDEAITEAKEDPRPSLILCKTHIGYGLPTRQDTAKAHGEPTGIEELNGAKQKLGWPLEPWYHVPDDVREHFGAMVSRGAELEDEWNKIFQEYQKGYPDEAEELHRRFDGELPDGWDSDLPWFGADPRGIATRAASGKIINKLADKLPELMGGSADLTGSNKTWIDSSTAFQKDTPNGRNIYFGVREHSMGGIVNGIAVHGGIIPYSGTFFIFSDYMRPALRVSALSKYPCIWIFTHDSIGLGEDGPTHQPIEHLASLRAMPEMVVIRPADANEVVEAWRVAIKRRDGPTMIVLTRQNVPILDRETYESAEGLAKGAYILKDVKNPDIILMASGSEVDLITKAAEQLQNQGISARVVSFPSWKLFEAQSQEYREHVLPSSIERRLAVEAGASLGWDRWIGLKGRTITIDHFGASAPADVLFEKFGFSVENIVETVKDMMK